VAASTPAARTGPPALSGIAERVGGTARLTAVTLLAAVLARVTEWALWVYGTALLVPGLFTAPAAILAAVPLVALGGGLVMSLPYSLLMPLMPKGEHGLLTGVYSVSRGIGVMLGPLLAGLAIKVAEPLFESTRGYAVTWLVCSAAVLLSIPLLRAMRARSRTAASSGATTTPPDLAYSPWWAIVDSSASAGWRLSSLVCWTTIGTLDSISAA
jgi:hypothetical protein